MHHFLFFLCFAFCQLLADVHPLASVISKKEYTIPFLHHLHNHLHNYYEVYFQNIIKKYKNDNSHQIMINPFIDQTQISWQMEGLGAFVPEKVSESIPIYIAKKRRATLNIFNLHNLLGEPQEDYHIKLLNESHTERQLIRKLLLGKREDAQGTVFIYTQQAPCQGRNYDNGFFSCIEYYNALTKKFSNITFKIYFEITSFNEEIAKTSKGSLSRIILSIIDCIETGDIIAEPYFRLENGALQYNPNPKAASSISASPTKAPRWKDISAMSEHTDKVDFIKKVNSWFSELNETVQIYFFNQAFGNENLKFYIIPPHPPK